MKGWACNLKNMALTKKTKVVVKEAAEPVDESASVDAYIAGIPEPARSTLAEVRETIRALVPAGTTEKISYGMPTFQYKGGLVGYAAFAKHCGFYPMNSAVIEKFAVELAKYPTSKGAIRFPIDKPLPAGLLKKLVLTRVAENARKK
jgi:uncharacterized protein YdhG (YjbR/CyaY superfamily)